MNEVSSHTIKEVPFRIHDVLVIEEELVRLHEQLILDYHLILCHLVLHDCAILQVVVRYCLSTEQDQRFLVNHMESDQPDLLVLDYVDYLPLASVHV